MVGVDGTHHVRHRRAQRAGAVHLLAPGVLVHRSLSVRGQKPPGAHDERAVDAPEDHGAGDARRASSARSSAHCGAFAATSTLLGRREVGGAHVDAGAGGDTQPLALLGACL